VESFFHRLKTELVHHRQCAIRNDAERGIFTYIEGLNRHRIQSAIFYISPIDMELKAALSAVRFFLEDQDVLDPFRQQRARLGSSSNCVSHRILRKPIISKLFASRRVRNQTFTALPMLTRQELPHCASRHVMRGAARRLHQP